MTLFYDLVGQSVTVNAHKQTDKSFSKKPFLSITTAFELDREPSILFGQLRDYKQSFYINGQPDEMTEAALKQVFSVELNRLNSTLSNFETTEFIVYLIKHTQDYIAELPKIIRDDNGRLASAFTHRLCFTSCIEEYLQSKGINAKCNIQRGTLYVDDKVVINSGLTKHTLLSNGIPNYLSLKAEQQDVIRYEEQYYKATQRHLEPGSWLDVNGDDVYICTYKMLLLSALRKCLIKLEGWLSDSIVPSSLLESVNREYEACSVQFDELFPAALDKESILSWDVVKSSESMQEIEMLGLGDAAKDAFFEEESPMVIAELLKERIGANHVTVFDPRAVEKNMEQYGYENETFSDSVPLPNKDVRQALKIIKEDLSDKTSVFSYFIDADKLKINISADGSYNPETDTFSKNKQFIDICIGAKYPVTGRSQIIRFSFNDK
jgi:hypothetical protein